MALDREFLFPPKGYTVIGLDEFEAPEDRAYKIGGPYASLEEAQNKVEAVIADHKIATDGVGKVDRMFIHNVDGRVEEFRDR